MPPQVSHTHAPPHSVDPCSPLPAPVSPQPRLCFSISPHPPTPRRRHFRLTWHAPFAHRHRAATAATLTAASHASAARHRLGEEERGETHASALSTRARCARRHRYTPPASPAPQQRHCHCPMPSHCLLLHRRQGHVHASLQTHTLTVSSPSHLLHLLQTSFTSGSRHQHMATTPHHFLNALLRRKGHAAR